MPRQSSEKITLTTHDVSAYFSEEEWTLLQEWQKELYRNVMNEIHQALIALGPLIATSVSSSRAKEKEDVYPLDNKDSARRYSDDHCRNDSVDDFDVVIGMNQEKKQSMKNHQSTHTNEGDLIIVPVDSFRVKEENDACFMDLEDSGAKENVIYPTSSASCIPISTNLKERRSVGPNQEVIPQIGYPTVTPLATHKCLNEEKHNFHEVGPVESMNSGLITSINSTEQQEANDWERTLTCDFGRSMSQKSHSHQKMCPPEKTYAYTEYNSNFVQKSNILEHKDSKKCQKPFTLIDWGTSLNKSSTMQQQQEINTTIQMCICSQCGRCFNQSTSMTTEQLISNSQQQNICSECMKIVGFSSNLSKDPERPYKCSDCGKSFKTSQTLIRHRRMHTGERPYVCSECGKSFRRPHTLMTHQLLHTGDKPYTCVTCGRNFRQIPHLMKHQRTHMREKEPE